MEDFQVYSRIQQEKRQGFSKEAAARHLSLNWRTVDQYWDMSIEEYEAKRGRLYTSGLEIRKDTILQWLRDYEDVSSSQIQDWLLEHYRESYKDRTVRDFVFKLRKLHDIPRVTATREYGNIPELPPGQQLQADFGVLHAIRENARRIRLHFVIFVLAHSRYKFLVWQSRHFTSIDFVRALEACFEAFGGLPQELVIDQDRLMTVDENYGDIIHTYEFERCKTRHGFTVWLCRKGDPESKGMVESGVKFVKYNFARNRVFISLEQWSQDSVDWLARTGNGKVHAETKRIPAEVFETERHHLKPLVAALAGPEPESERTTPVRKNNTIRYGSSRYSVPFGTYGNFQTVKVLEEDGQLLLYSPDGVFIDSHPLNPTPGSLNRKTNHARDTSSRIQQLVEEAQAALGGTPQAIQFLQTLQRVRRRYVRDQMLLVLKTARQYEPEILRQAVNECLDCGSTTATDLRDFAESLHRQITLEEMESPRKVKPLAEPPLPALRLMRVVQHAPAVYEDRIRKGGRVNG